jgi:C1A family cysteine protease
MKSYISSYGPMTVSFDVYDNFMNINYDARYDDLGSVTNPYVSTEGSAIAGRHAVVIYGYGPGRGYGTKYWRVKNSWGSR